MMLLLFQLLCEMMDKHETSVRPETKKRKFVSRHIRISHLTSGPILVLIGGNK